MKYLKYFLYSVLLLSVFIPHVSIAADDGQISIQKAKVLEIINESEKTLPGSDVPSPVQKIEIEITQGSNKGQKIIFDNDYVMLEKNEPFYLSTNTQIDGSTYYSVFEPDRTKILLFFLVLFIVLVLIFGGLQGLRGLVSLAGSLLVIIFILLPSIIHGFSPLLVSMGVSSIIIILGSYITHGFNKTTSSAVLGMIATVVVTGIMAYYAVYSSHLTGVSSDETFYLNLNVRGGIDLVGLLMGGIMIGLLGVLYDVAIGQAVSVEELHSVAPHLGKWEIYKRAVRIGKEHIGALVNTLAIAYVGASLPLLLLFYSSSNSDLALIINREIFSTEIIRILIGSIGLVLAVPITTLLAVYMLVKKEALLSPQALEKEKEDLENFTHKH